MREQIRIQTGIATRRIDDRNGKRKSVKERLRWKMTKKKNGEERREQAKDGKGCVKEGEQLCRSKWSGLIRHKTLHTGAKKAEMTCYVSQSGERTNPSRQPPNCPASHSPRPPPIPAPPTSQPHPGLQSVQHFKSQIFTYQVNWPKRRVISLRAIHSQGQRTGPDSESHPLSVSWSGSPFIKQLLQSQYIIIYPVTYLASWSV